MMKNGIVFKMAERGIGLKYIDEFKNKMYSNEYLNFGMLAYCYGDKKLSKEFTLLAMNNSNSPDTKKPYSNLFYLCRRHDKMFNQDKYLSEELLKYIKKESNSIDIINLILYDYKNQINFSWKESISKIKKLYTHFMQLNGGGKCIWILMITMKRRKPLWL